VFRVWGLGFRVLCNLHRLQGLGSGLRVEGSGVRVEGLGFRAQGLKVLCHIPRRLQDLRLRVKGLGFKL
jgi:hypothetical protein